MTVTYLDGTSELFEVEELSEVHGLIERGPNWYRHREHHDHHQSGCAPDDGGVTENPAVSSSRISCPWGSAGRGGWWPPRYRPDRPPITIRSLRASR
jgi:hypothetical protein